LLSGREVGRTTERGKKEGQQTRHDLGKKKKEKKPEPGYSLSFTQGVGGHGEGKKRQYSVVSRRVRDRGLAPGKKGYYNQRCCRVCYRKREEKKRLGCVDHSPKSLKGCYGRKKYSPLVIRHPRSAGRGRKACCRPTAEKKGRGPSTCSSTYSCRMISNRRERIHIQIEDLLGGRRGKKGDYISYLCRVGKKNVADLPLRTYEEKSRCRLLRNVTTEFAEERGRAPKGAH